MGNLERLKINIVVGGRFHAAQLYRSLKELGHDVRIYASSPRRYFKGVPKSDIIFVPKPVQLIQKGLKVRAPRWFSEISTSIFDFLVSSIMRDADIVWGFNGDSLRCGRRAKRKGGVYVLDRACPHISVQTKLLTEESLKTGVPFAPLSPRTMDRFHEEYRVSDKIVVPSEYSAKSFYELGFPAQKVTIAPLGANAPSDTGTIDNSESTRQICDDRFKIGMVGGSFLRKGVIYLLRAISEIDDYKVQLYLRASERDILKTPEARELAASNHVTFVPYLEDINEFYRSLDVFVLPSVDEGFGMVVYEALRQGTPVIATDHVGATGGMRSGIEYIRVAAQDHTQLAQAINRLKSDSALRKRIGAAGKKFYQSRSDAGSQYTCAIRSIIKSIRPGVK